MRTLEYSPYLEPRYKYWPLGPSKIFQPPSRWCSRRMRSLLACLALGLGTFVSAAPSKECAHKVKESVQPPRGWVQRRPAPPDLPIDLRIALPQPNFGILEQHLYEVRYVTITAAFF